MAVPNAADAFRILEFRSATAPVAMLELSLLDDANAHRPNADVLP